MMNHVYIFVIGTTPPSFFHVYCPLPCIYDEPCLHFYLLANVFNVGPYHILLLIRCNRSLVLAIV
jgi:hypothetical protein